MQIFVVNIAVQHQPKADVNRGPIVTRELPVFFEPLETTNAYHSILFAWVTIPDLWSASLD